MSVHLRSARPGGLQLEETLHVGALRKDLSVFRHSSGIRVALCPLPGPLCQADIVIPTECGNNGGLPHCLEHLVFMGSQRYQSRGYLDKLANLCISQGTNAWTDRDHTAYNAITAGPVGLQRLLPVLLDHVLSPTLTEEQFLTEVFHVDGEGRAKGVVYCEMQGREATEDDLSDHNLHELLYPDSGYRFECGGLTPDIEKISNADVQDYHRRYYSPSNCLVLVHGQVSRDSLEAALDEWAAHTDAFNVQEGESVMGQAAHPWQNVPAPLAASVSRTVDFAAEDEDVGSVTLGWSGPPLGDMVTCEALQVLFRFLQDGAASPLAQHFVECPQPLASSVDFDLELRLRTCLKLEFSGVPNGAGTAVDGEEDSEDEDDEEELEDEEDEQDGEEEDDGDGMEEDRAADDGASSALEPGMIKEQVMGVLKEFVVNGFPTGALAAAIDRHWVKVLEECEDEPSEALQNYVLPELVFAPHVATHLKSDAREPGAVGAGVRARPATALDTRPILDELRLKDEAFWKGLLDTWVVSAPVAEVVMKPSGALAKQRSAAELLSVEQRRSALGKVGLAACQQKLEAALRGNAPQPLPTQADGSPLLTPPPAASIPTLAMTVAMRSMPRSLAPVSCTVAAAPHLAPNVPKHETKVSAGTAVQVVRTDTAFHSVSIGFDCRHVPPQLRPWLVLLQEVLMSSDILEADGSVTRYTDAIKLRQQQTVSMWTSTGWGGGAFSASVMPELFFIRGQALPSAQGYGYLCKWLGSILGRSLLGPDRVAVCAKNLNKDITSSLRDGESVCSAISSRITLHQLLSDDAGFQRSSASDLRSTRKSNKRGSGQSQKAASAALNSEMSEHLVGSRNDAAVNLLVQRPLLRRLVDGIKASHDAAAPESKNPRFKDHLKRSGRPEDAGSAATEGAVAALTELRQRILVELASGTSNAVFIQISAPHQVEEGGDDESLVAELHSQLSCALQHLASSSSACTKPSDTDTRKRVRTGRGSMRERAAEPSAGVGVGVEGGSRESGASEGLEMLIPMAGVQRSAAVEQAMVVAVKGCDSTYLEMVVPCGVHKKSAEYAALYLLCELLSRSEGPMWERIRGRGLAYHASLELWPWQGQIGFSLGECADPAAAWKEMEAILTECRSQLSATDRATTSALDAALTEARCSALFSLHSKRSTAGAAASTAAKAYWWGVGEIEGEADREAAAIEAVEAHDLLGVFDRYLSMLLSPAQRSTSVVVPAGKEEEVCSSLQSALGLAPDSIAVRSLADLMIPREA